MQLFNPLLTKHATIQPFLKIKYATKQPFLEKLCPPLLVGDVDAYDSFESFFVRCGRFADLSCFEPKGVNEPGLCSLIDLLELIEAFLLDLCGFFLLFEAIFGKFCKLSVFSS